MENVEKANYGPNGEFYKLSKICLTYRSPSYVYKLCPYAEASQDDGMKATPLTLGKGGVLNLSDPNSPKVKQHFKSDDLFYPFLATDAEREGRRLSERNLQIGGSQLRLRRGR